MSLKILNTQVTNSDYLNALSISSSSSSVSPSVTYTLSATIDFSATPYTTGNVIPFLDFQSNNIVIPKGMIVSGYLSTSVNLSAATPTITLYGTNIKGSSLVTTPTDLSQLTVGVAAVSNAFDVKALPIGVAGSSYSHQYLYLTSSSNLTSGKLTVTLIMAY